MPSSAQKVKPGKPAKPDKPMVTEVCKDEIDEITERRTFQPWDKPTVGCRFHRFREIGETIEGKLGFQIRNFRQATSYPLELDNGETVEILGNRILHKLIRVGELCGQRVRIIFIGKEAVWGGHYRNVFRAFKVEN